MLGFAPSRPAPLVAPVISVDLMASLPGPATPQKPVATQKPAAKLPKPVPKPPPKAPPKVKKIVLPKKAPSATRKVRKVDRPPKRVKPEELDYSDAMAKLREELGEAEPSPEVVAKVEAPRPPSSGEKGIRVDPKVAAWMLAVKRHVRAGWITPPEFLDRDLNTRLVVDLAADGRVLGQPRVVISSGDPFWDDSAIRAVLRASPLPPPPGPGEWPFGFPSQEGR